MAQLITFEDARIALALDSLTSEQRTLLDSLITNASAAIESYCRRVFASASYTELHDGDGLRRIQTLDQFPVSVVTTLHDDPNREYGSGTLIDAVNYVTDLAEGIIKLDLGLRFARGVQNIQIVYTAGFAAIPDDLQQATIRLVAAWWHKSTRDPNVKSEKLMSWSATYRDVSADELPADVLSVLNFYRKAVVT